MAAVPSALANKPLSGGFAWVPLSYALGLRRLGFDVYLLEQIGAEGGVGAAGRRGPIGGSINRAFFLEVTGDFGFEGRGTLLHDDGTVAGLDATHFRQVASEAEILVNISGHTTLDWVVNGPRLA